MNNLFNILHRLFSLATSTSVFLVETTAVVASGLVKDSIHGSMLSYTLPPQA